MDVVKTSGIECNTVERTNGTIKMYLSWEGDGYNGSIYNPEDASDVPLLRLHVERPDKPLKDGDWITFVDARQSETVRALCLDYLFERLYFSAVIDQLRPLIEEVMFIDETWVTDPTRLPFRNPQKSSSMAYPEDEPKAIAGGAQADGAGSTESGVKIITNQEIREALKATGKEPAQASLALVPYN